MTAAGDAERLLPLPEPEAARNHRSIGEVLALLQSEFDDVTISKIRFLEAQGLIEPERTPSGYRRFYELDVLRLRWVLLQQRDNFLPLRVIKERLDALAETELKAEVAAGPREPRPLVLPEPRLFERTDDVPATVTPPTPATARPRRERRKKKANRSTPTNLSGPALAESLGIEHSFIEELERYGLIEARHLGSEALFDAEAADVAAIAAHFASLGIDPRHLRMYKMAVERELSLFEQILLPLVRDRDDKKRAEARERLGELFDFGDQLRELLIAKAVRELG